MLAEDDRHQMEAGRDAWLPPDILPWQAWVDRTWRLLRERDEDLDARLLNAEQEQSLWEQAVAALPDASDLFLPTQVARDAQRAWSLVEEYLLDRDELLRIGGGDTRALLQARAWVQSRCRDEGWRTFGDRVRDLSTATLPQGIAPMHLSLAGFDQLTPGQARLIAALKAAGSAIEILPPPTRRGRHSVLPAADPSTELKNAATAALRVLRSSPDARVGIVLHDLEERRFEVESVFDDVLSPDRILPGGTGEGRAWDMSLGRPLSGWPMVSAALGALELCLRSCQYTAMGLFLRSPYFGDATEEGPQHALLDGWLRKSNYFELDLLSLADIANDAPAAEFPDCSALVMRLCGLETEVRSWPATAGPAFWSGAFDRALRTLNWPGERALDSAEFQCADKWRELLARLAGLGGVAGEMGPAECLGRLRRLADDTLFQPEGSGAPIQILGMLETPGLSFDLLWVIGMHDQAWPRPLRPNALIPAGLQRRLGIPRACPDTELKFATAKTEQLRLAADEVVFSWPRQSGEETLRPSALIEGFPRGPAMDLPAGVENRIHATAGIEALADERMPRWQRGATARGGSALVKAMAACPFQAQARFRLSAESLQQPSPGISSIEAGRIAHLALQWLWAEWKDSDGLKRLEHGALLQAVNSVVEGACRQIIKGSGALKTALRTIETERASARIVALCLHDLQRPGFVVEDLEKGTDLQLEGVGLRLRVDRIDRLDDGGLLLIDYKTGQTSIRDWLGERLREPQLPLYALALGDEVRALAFGNLAAGKEGFIGIGETGVDGTDIGALSESARRMDGVQDWDEITALWGRVLEALMRSFADGEARVAPRRVSEECRFCDLTAFCRRHELAGQGALFSG
jgi:probable DNA repair protein